MILNWIRKRFGVHVCEEFTQWERHTVHKERNPEPVVDSHAYITGQKVEWDEVWQERHCTLCGKIYQERLKV